MSNRAAKLAGRVAPEELYRVKTTAAHANSIGSTPSRRASFNEALILTKKAVLRGSVAIEAANAMQLVLRNAAASCICAWIANFLLSVGNPFALTSSRDQSTASLILTNLVWTNVIYCGIMLLTHTTMLRPLRFLSNPDTPPTLRFCIKQLLRATYAYFIVSLVLNVCLGLLVGRVLSSRVHEFKIEFYIATLINHNYMTGVGLATRSIFKTRTRQGQEWTLRQQEQQQQLLRQLRPRRPRKQTRTRLYWKAFTTGSSKLIPMFLVGCAYIQVVSQTHLFNHGLKTFTFVAVSTATKVLAQAAIKMYVIKYRVKDIRTMCALVGLPTVLIDTQVRIMLLCQQNYKFATTGVLVMAVVEVILRGGKAAWLSVELRRKQSTVRDLSLQGFELQTKSTVTGKTNIARQPPKVVSQHDFDQLRQITNRFHAAESSADMHAGYIAIGCSASIWFFYSENPHFDLGLRTSDNDRTLVLLLLLQVGVEAVADYISCVLEAAAGVDFKSLNRFGSFLALIFANHAILNVIISAVFFLK